MKLIDVINNLDKSTQNQCYVSLESLCEELNVEYHYGDEEPVKITAYFWASWYCTDSWVGGRAYFFDNELVAISWQDGRKNDEVFAWVSIEKAEAVRNYIKSLLAVEDWKNYIDIELDLNEEVGIGFKRSFSGEINTNTVIEEATGLRCKVVRTYNYQDDTNGVGDWHTVDVVTELGEEKNLHMNAVIIPFSTVNQRSWEDKT